jgi:hypothetical protein
MAVIPTTPCPTGPMGLVELAARVRRARVSLHELRAVGVSPGDLRSARDGLLSAMEAYAAELTRRRVPIPPRLRDDLRLLRRVRH